MSRSQSSFRENMTFDRGRKPAQCAQVRWRIHNKCRLTERLNEVNMRRGPSGIIGHAQHDGGWVM